MAKTELTREILEAMILGGSLLGGGGRGTTDEANLSNPPLGSSLFGYVCRGRTGLVFATSKYGSKSVRQPIFGRRHIPARGPVGGNFRNDC